MDRDQSESDRTNITNLLFADDMVLFGEASVAQARVIKKILDDFCAASGEKVSISKTRIFFSANTEANMHDSIAAEMQFTETNDLGTYLGVPTINGRVTRATCAQLEEKIHKRLAGWATKRISLAGRSTLVKSTLSTKANYHMQSIKLTRSICDDIDRKSRRYLWGGS